MRFPARLESRSKRPFLGVTEGTIALAYRDAQGRACIEPRATTPMVRCPCVHYSEVACALSFVYGRGLPELVGVTLGLGK